MLDHDGAGPQAPEEFWTLYDTPETAAEIAAAIYEPGTLLSNPWADVQNGSLTSRYLYTRAIDEVLARLEDDQGIQDLAWYLADRLGSVRQQVQTDGTILNEITYDSFGNVVTETDPAEGDRFKYTGREYDDLTGLYYYRARWYDAGTGKFLSEDPLGFAAGDYNLSRYVSNDPTNAIDPSGLEYDPAAPEWHHRIPQKFRKKLLKAGFTDEELHSKDNGLLIPAQTHRRYSHEWNKAWDDFFRDNPEPTKEQIYEHLKKLEKDPRFKEFLKDATPAPCGYREWKNKRSFEKKKLYQTRNAFEKTMRQMFTKSASLKPRRTVPKYKPRKPPKNRRSRLPLTSPNGKIPPFSRGVRSVNAMDLAGGALIILQTIAEDPRGRDEFKDALLAAQRGDAMACKRALFGGVPYAEPFSGALTAMEDNPPYGAGLIVRMFNKLIGNEYCSAAWARKVMIELYKLYCKEVGIPHGYKE